MSETPDPAPDLDWIEARARRHEEDWAEYMACYRDPNQNWRLEALAKKREECRPVNSHILSLVALARRQAAEIAMLNAEVDRLEARIESIVDRQT